MNEIKIGIIGAGNIAQQHLGVINAFSGIKVVGINSRTKSKADQLISKYSIDTPYFDDAEELVQTVKPDALMILVSADQMFNVCKKVIPFRLPMFIEKPAGLNPEDNEELVTLAKEFCVPTMVGFNRRYYSIFRKGLEIIKQHGKLMGVKIEGHERFWKIKDKVSEVMREKWLYANSVHTIDLLRYFGGEVDEVKAFAHSHVEKRGDQFAAIMELESGAIGQYSAHWYSPGGWHVVLYGDGVTVEFRPLEQGIYIDKDFKKHEIIPDSMDVEYKAGFYSQMDAFLNLIKSGKKEWPMQDLEGSYKTMLLAQKISENIQGRA